MTLTIARLDRNKPPPKWEWYDDREEYVVDLGTGRPGLLRLDAAWAHYQEHHDPPGSATWSAERRAAAWPRYWWRVAVAVHLANGPFARLTCECNKPPKSWLGKGASICQHVSEYLRILSIDFWPHCLAWSDEQVFAVERWLSDGGEVPEVLRGR